jgi:hemerythrin-like metal-binding protein
MWKNSYAVGNDLIDNQHRELFAMTDDLVDAIRRRKGSAGPDACARAVTFLKDYTVKHFSDEEDLQAALGYAGLTIHKKAHLAAHRAEHGHDRPRRIQRHDRIGAARNREHRQRKRRFQDRGMGYACDITPPKLYRGQRPFLIGGKTVKCALGAMAVFFNRAPALPDEAHTAPA